MWVWFQFALLFIFHDFRFHLSRICNSLCWVIFFLFKHESSNTDYHTHSKALIEHDVVSVYSFIYFFFILLLNKLLKTNKLVTMPIRLTTIKIIKTIKRINLHHKCHLIKMIFTQSASFFIETCFLWNWMSLGKVVAFFFIKYMPDKGCLVIKLLGSEKNYSKRYFTIHEMKKSIIAIFEFDCLQIFENFSCLL